MIPVNPIDPGEESTILCRPPTRYPRGTELELEGDLAEQLNVDSFKAGEKVEIRATAFVKEKSEESEDGSEVEKELCLQITGITVNKVGQSAVDKMYPKEG